MHKHVVTGLALVLGCFSSLALAAPGEYWEMTNKMEMQGMAMPGMTQKICVPKGGERDPRNSSQKDKSCEMTDMKTSGNKTSWKMRCDQNGEVMTGSGEMSSFPDRNEGVTRLSTKDGDMTMSYVNKRVGGACDTEELTKKFDAIAAAQKNEMAKHCDGMVKTEDWMYRSSYILGKDAPCAAKKDQFCEIMKREVGNDLGVYFHLKNPDTGISKACGISLDASHKAVCKSVNANNAEFAKQMRGEKGSYYLPKLRAECPGEMKIYAEVSRKRYCEGRAFTEKQRVSLANCLKGGSGDDEALNTPDPEEPEAPAEAVASPAKKAGGKSSGKTEAAAATAPAAPPEQGSTGKLLDGLSIPGLPSGSGPSADAVIEGAKKLKSLFGF